MSALAPAPAVPPRRPVRWTVEPFHDLSERGYFEGRRAGLTRGTIFEKGPMNPPYRIALELTDTAVRFAFGPGWRVCVQMPLVLGHDTDPEPVSPPCAGPSVRGATAHPTTAALVIETADTSLDYDLSTKAELYATGSIPEDWVLDVDDRTSHIFRDPIPRPSGLSATAYQTHLSHADTDTVSPLAVPSVTVSVGELLP